MLVNQKEWCALSTLPRHYSERERRERMTITLFYIPPSPLPSSSQARLYKYNNNSSSCPNLTYPSSSRKLFVTLCSPPSTSTPTPTPTPVVEEDPPPSPDELPLPLQPDYAAAAIPSGGGCKACGRGEIEKGCNGDGRIQGGIATVPGFGWWPIKAYRPCPGFVASGGRYRRQGQSMDEVAFGRGPTPSDSATSSKKQGAKKSKR